jgi:hypothetical protein
MAVWPEKSYWMSMVISELGDYSRKVRISQLNRNWTIRGRSVEVE